MPFDTDLAARVRQQLGSRRHLDEKKMFGGLVFLLHGNILVGVWRDALIVRVGPDAYEDARREDFVDEFDVTGKPMRGWVMVRAEGVETPHQLQPWLDSALAYVDTLPMKWEAVQG